MSIADIEQAERRIEESIRRLTEQRRIVTKLAGTADSEELALQLLQQMERSLDNQIRQASLATGASYRDLAMQAGAERSVEVYIAEREDTPGAWTVEATDPEEGSVEQAIFIGPDAEARAREYAGWKYGHAPAERRPNT